MVRYVGGVDVPHLGQLLHVLVVGPVAEPWEVAVGAALSGVLGRGLTVHLQQTASGPSEHPAEEVDVVYLNGRGSGLVGLVEALKDRGDQPFGGADQTSR